MWSRRSTGLYTSSLLQRDFTVWTRRSVGLKRARPCVEKNRQSEAKKPFDLPSTCSKTKTDPNHQPLGPFQTGQKCACPGNYISKTIYMLPKLQQRSLITIRLIDLRKKSNTLSDYEVLCVFFPQFFISGCPQSYSGCRYLNNLPPALICFKNKCFQKHLVHLFSQASVSKYSLFR